MRDSVDKLKHGFVKVITRRPFEKPENTVRNGFILNISYFGSGRIHQIAAVVPFHPAPQRVILTNAVGSKTPPAVAQFNRHSKLRVNLNRSAS
jgi:hypothetical protein